MSPKVKGKLVKTDTSMHEIKKFMVETHGISPGKGRQSLDGSKKTSNKEREPTPSKETVKQKTLNTNPVPIPSDDTQRGEDERNNAFPTTVEIMEMFQKMENFIRGEITTLRGDFGHLITRVEEVEEKCDAQELVIQDLKDQIGILQRNQRNIEYKIEDQENRNRRKNLRIRGMPEEENESLEMKISELYNPILQRPLDQKIKIERIHRIKKPPTVPTDLPRDIIVRFSEYQDRAQIHERLKGTPTIEYRGAKIQTFTDLSKATLYRRRLLKPLLEEMKLKSVKYSWGFPACLVGTKEGRTARLRMPEDLPHFCERLDLNTKEIPGWSEKGREEARDGRGEGRWGTVVRGKKQRMEGGAAASK